METSNNPKFAVIYVGVNGDGEVVDVKDCADTPLGDEHYDPGTTKRIKNGAVLMSENWCRWKLVSGVWMCVPV